MLINYVCYPLIDVVPQSGNWIRNSKVCVSEVRRPRLGVGLHFPNHDPALDWTSFAATQRGES
jgi:hypothetical protein